MLGNRSHWEKFASYRLLSAYSSLPLQKAVKGLNSMIGRMDSYQKLALLYLKYNCIKLGLYILLNRCSVLALEDNH